MSRATKGYLIGITGVTFWSFTGIFIDYLVNHYHMPALLLAFWRNMLVCLALAPVLFFTRRSLLRIPRSQIAYFVFYGLLLGVFNSIWTLSVRANGASVATVVAYSSAGFTAILAWIIFKEKLGPPKIIAIILSLGGCILVSNAYSADIWKLNLLGVTTGLLSGIFFAVYTLVGKETARLNINSWTAMLYSFGFGTIFILIFNLFPSIPGAAGSFPALLPNLPLDGWLCLVFLAFIPTIFGFGLYNMSMYYIPASIANILAMTEPVMTSIEAYFLLHQGMSVIQIIGSAIILSAVLIVQLQKE